MVEQKLNILSVFYLVIIIILLFIFNSDDFDQFSNELVLLNDNTLFKSVKLAYSLQY